MNSKDLKEIALLKTSALACVRPDDEYTNIIAQDATACHAIELLHLEQETVANLLTIVGNDAFSDWIRNKAAAQAAAILELDQ